MVEVMKTRSHTCTPALSAANPAACHCRPTPLPETPGHSWASLGQSLLWSLFVSPGSWCVQGFVCALQESFPQSCVSSAGSTATSSKRAYAIPLQVCCTRSPRSRPLLTRTSTGDTQTQFWLSLCGVSGSWCTQALLEPSKCL